MTHDHLLGAEMTRDISGLAVARGEKSPAGRRPRQFSHLPVEHAIDIRKRAEIRAGELLRDMAEQTSRPRPAENVTRRYNFNAP